MKLYRDNDVFYLSAKVMSADAAGNSGALVYSQETQPAGTEVGSSGSAGPAIRVGASPAEEQLSAEEIREPGSGAGLVRLAAEEDAVAARGPTLPVVPSAEERERHALTHLRFRP